MEIHLRKNTGNASIPKFPVHAASWKQTDAGQKSRPIADFSFLTSE
ncbi:hypothetical protein LptCag_2605 [Leptospirillum ferriphilum]|uniref:Uncharacterized protein n=1 Tax=Leptospirillum ferriphilum TaxID=178606 RepID=A0A094YPJ4_9BACT|nr:hypothetical protein LptCag_2605 [Leptospirillum ferriphilum]